MQVHVKSIVKKIKRHNSLQKLSEWIFWHVLNIHLSGFQKATKLILKANQGAPLCLGVGAKQGRVKHIWYADSFQLERLRLCGMPATHFYLERLNQVCSFFKEGFKSIKLGV